VQRLFVFVKIFSKILAVDKIKGDIMLNTPMPPMFQEWKSKSQPNMHKDRWRDR
jgi:hypothetical protein